MKLIILLALCLISLPSFATKARLEALGQSSVNGSYYIDDTRNLFRNPAHANMYKNFLVTEWGEGDTANSSDSNTAPHAEGGFIRELGNFVYGLYLGSTANSMNDYRSNTTGLAGITTGDSNFLSQDNRVDFVFAGDAGTGWGVRAFYASSEEEAVTVFPKSNSAYGLGLGFMTKSAELYGNFLLKDESEGATVQADKWEAELGYTIGANYQLSGNKIFLEYDHQGFSYENSTGGYTQEGDFNNYVLGLGNTALVADKARLFTDVALNMGSQKFSGNASSEVEWLRIPFAIAFEAEATSWLVLRGSVSQDLLRSYKQDDKEVSSKTTTVSAGATLNFKRVKVDGLVGASEDAGPAHNKRGILSANELLTRVAIHYWF